MTQNFDQLFDRSGTYSSKWSKFDKDVLPFWVADMDFAAPDFVLDAIRQRLDHPILGYTEEPDSLVASFQGWLAHHYNWQVPAEWVVWIPGVVPMLNLAARCVAPDGGILIPTPVYHPFLSLARHAGIEEVCVPMHADTNWRMDFDAMAAALTPRTKMMMICNPQNPTGRCYAAEELAQLATFVAEHDLYLVSDEIHCNIVLDENCRHQPVAAAHPEIAARTISLYAATKVYNIPGISCAAAVIPDDSLRRQFMHERAGLITGIGPVGYTASEAAFNDRSDWIPQLLSYLRGNLAEIQSCVGERLSPLQATYLAWIDVADLRLADTEAYFAQQGIGISPGAQFGAPDYIRLNFGCPRALLRSGLDRLSSAIDQAKTG